MAVVGAVTSKTPWDNIANYKPCRMKLHDLYVCKPPVGTVVIDHLSHPDIVKSVGGNTWFSAEDLAKPNFQQLLVYLQQLAQEKQVSIVSKDDVVIAGVRGELKTERIWEVTEHYEMMHNGQFMRVSTDLLSQRSNSDGTFDWLLIRLAPSVVQRYNCFACYVPTKVKGIVVSVKTQMPVNVPGVQHGKGDFVVAYGTLGPGGKMSPSPKNRFVVNGEVFSLTYNNQGWSDCLSFCQPIGVGSLPRLFTPKSNGQDSNLPKEIVTLQKSFENAVQSGVLVSYDPTQVPVVVTKFTDDIVKRMSVEVGSYINEEFLYVMRIRNVKEVVDVFCSKNGQNVYVKLYDEGVRKFSISNMQEIKSFITLIAGLQKRGFLSNMRTTQITEQDLQSLKAFTGSLYTTLNTAMYEGKVKSLGFTEWAACRSIYDSLRKSSVAGVRLFRGMNLSKRPKAGDIIKLPSFSSWSFSYTVAAEFGEYRFMINLNNRVEMIHINSLSHFRDEEYECILNAGYKLRVNGVVRTSEGTVFECELAKDSIQIDKLLKEFDYDKDEDHTQYAIDISHLPLRNKEIGGVLYLSIISHHPDDFYSEVIFSSRFGTDSKSSVIVDVSTSSFDVRWFEKGQERRKSVELLSSDAKTMQNLTALLETICKSIVPDEVKSIYPIGSKFMFDITSKFQNEGYQLLKQVFDEESVRMKVLRGSITITGDNDDHIALRFMISNDMKLKVAVRSNHTSLAKEFDVADQGIVDNVYNVVVTRFKLNQFHRVERALDLVSRYLGQSWKKLSQTSAGEGGTSESTAMYSVGSNDLTVSFSGNEMVFNNVKHVFFYDNLRKIASEISDLLRGQV